MKLYIHYLSIHLRSMMEYKVSFLLTIIGQFLVSFNVFLGVYFMLQRFHQIEGFSYSEVLLCFAIVLMSFTLAECFFRGFDTFASMIGNGEFDRILVRPRGAIFQVLASKIELTRIGRLLQAIVMLIYGISNIHLHWTFLRVLTLVLMILGGVATFAGLFILYAGLCFFTLEGLEFMNIFTDGAREYGKYPVAVYGKTVLTICTYIVPFALFQYYPFLYLTRQNIPAYYSFLPLLTILFLIPCFFVWNLGMGKYKSTGS